ncbi:MAG: L-threonylcarbamoyladenylate synthase [Prevotellaceae bacterium]|nr:L-threonylcarbamoyladenylate synthase [Prevotellaceae bacterium]MDY3856738.1 L-threonylcarbamoyladenylate synthase [Bacteroidaceae bacterium]
MKVNKIKVLTPTSGDTAGRKPHKPLPKQALDDIRQAVEVMRHGGVILYPTDTVWGLGCDATNEEAVQKVYAIKHRSDSKALITLVDSEAKVQFYVRQVPQVAWDVIQLSTRPTTIIYDGARNLAPNLIAEDGSVGIRITEEDFSRELCQRFKKAIVSTSANVSGQPTPQNYAEIPDEIKEKVDFIVTFRQDDKTKAKPSSIIKLGAKGEVKVIR